jgi:hypothetical protein
MRNTLTLLFALTSIARADFADPAWRYTLKKPTAANWQQTGFDDSGWREGFGGFGERSTPNARISTEWTTKNIWLRRTVEMEKIPAKPAIYIYHDEDAQIFLNGKKVAEFKGFKGDYFVHPIEASAVKPGKNLLAVHCSQTTGGQAIDVHLIDADNVPNLPAPKQAEHPFKSDLITEWGAKVTPENAWREYPRPQLVRENWTNLNGLWDYAITPKDAGRPDKWDGKILVPFAVESRLSGVQRLLHNDKALWYNRALDPKPVAGKRTILNFEACDYHTDVWVNNTQVGSHTGGNTPFSFDVTSALTSGDNQLYVRVEDSTDGFQLRGKQVANPHGIFYTQVSGLWGTVWTEEVSADYLQHLTIKTNTDGTVSIQLHGTGSAATVVASLGGKEVARGEGSGTVIVKIPEPKLWSPDSPALYDLAIKVGEDSVKSYIGIREVGRQKGADGHWRFTLNGKPIFHWGPLDQGWWPDGLLTPPSEDAMRWDVDYLKAAGFNMIRKHIKVEPRSFYAYCDKIGMMLWQDQVSGGPSPKWTFLEPDPKDADWPDEHHQQWMLEYERMISALESHPSIVVWVPFNEAWGQHRTVEVGKWTEKRDPSRLVNIASGGNFWQAGHIVDRHSYPHPSFPFDQNGGGRFDDYIKVVGEFGGHGLPTPDHLWDNSSKNWGYGGLPKDAAEYKERYLESIRILTELKTQGIDGGVYTQTTDVEGEINGLVTYDRKVIKIPASELKALHEPLLK